MVTPATGAAVVDRLPSEHVAPPIGLSAAESTFSLRVRWPIFMLMGASAGVLFAASALRHHAFRSGAMDLGFFDQLVYLISQGKAPVSSLLGFHLLGDHAAYTLYLLAPLYWIWSNVHMLLIAQAIALASGAYPIYRIAQFRGLSQRHALSVACAYLLYPIVLTANLFDFHPETISVPALLFAVLAAIRGRYAWFIASLLVALGGKEIIALTVIAMGVWLALFEHRRSHGVIAIALGASWFVIATQLVIPHFGAGREASGLRYFSYLGNSVREVALNLVLEPQRWLPVVFSLATIKYLIILFAPVSWGVVPRSLRFNHFRYLAPLIVCAAPTLAMNILARDPFVDPRHPFGQYSLMVVPFLAITFVYAVASGQSWLRRPRAIALWSMGLVLLGATARVAMIDRQHATNFAAQQATREALAHIDAKGAVLTTHEIASHVSQRDRVRYIDSERPIMDVRQFDYVLLNLASDSAINTAPLTSAIFEQVNADASFALRYQHGAVYLFRRQAVAAARE